jgi:small subunit ribosomal protein S6
LNSYELTMIFDPAQGEEKIGAFVAKIEDKIKSGKGEVERTEKSGVRKLASMVRKAKRLMNGYYVLVRFSGPGTLPAELKAFLKVSESVIRYLLTRAVEMPLEEEKPKEQPLEAVVVGEIQGGETGGKP